MDLPPSGWYPDPYGTPDLLRWWDGLNWTRHTHPGVGAADAESSSVQATTVQSGGGLAGGGQTSSGGGWASSDRVIGDWAGTDWPSVGQLTRTKPPKGPRTEPQPALPDTSVQPALPDTSMQPGAQATRYQPAVQATTTQAAVQATTTQAAVQATTTQAAVQPTTYQSAVQPTAYQQPVQPTAYQQPVQPTAYQQPVQQATAQPSGGVGGAVGDGTQVLFDAWQMPVGPGGPGGPGGPAQPNRYGYQEAQRRRRMWLIGGLTAGTAVAIGIIVVVATSMGGGSPQGTSAADQTRVTNPPAPTPSASAPASLAASASPSASPSASATPPASVLSDGQSGLSYSQLAAPWQAGCPSDLSSAFAWTAGESAVAGEVNNGQQTWYGEACSGPLPAQYSYAGPQDLDATAANVASTLETAYYNNLDHTVEPLLSQPVSISGHAGWEVEYTIDYTNAAAQGATWSSEEGAVIVTDTGTGNTPVVFFASVPNASALGTSDVSTLISSLQLSVVPNPAGGDGSPGPGGSPGD